ncbi:MAG: M23 family metallopeptidase [Solirubrobacterales bacterium]
MGWRWRPAALGILVGWNIAATLLYLEARSAAADLPSCDGQVRWLQEQLGQREGTIRDLSRRLRANITAVEKALGGTGLRLQRLDEPAAADDAQGGPFIPADPARDDIGRWDNLQRVVRVLPLRAPLTAFELTSGFGTRRDPINHRRAMHEGLDLKAPLRTAVHATGPGRVAFTGRKGRLGRVVEVDHGHGIVTRYGHLAAITVKRGQHIEAGHRVGLLGSSGRSTGPHLHYEVVVDGRPRDPMPFLRAGRGLMAANAQ